MPGVGGGSLLFCWRDLVGYGGFAVIHFKLPPLCLSPKGQYPGLSDDLFKTAR